MAANHRAAGDGESLRQVGSTAVNSLALLTPSSSFCRVIPATEAGIADHVWEIDELVTLPG
jgi:hypothetical protein